MYFLVYKITNKINSKEYIGAHKTSDLNDDYMGSGVHLSRAKEKYGINNFSKEIIFRAVSSEVMFFIEKMLVDEEYVKRKDTYNLKLGGQGGFDHLVGKVTVKDLSGNTSSVSINDSRYLSGELVHMFSGLITVKDKLNNIFNVKKDDSRYLSGELVSINVGTVNVRDNDNNIYHINVNDSRYLSGELVHIIKGNVTVKDIEGNIFNVKKDDSRYLSGELVHIWNGKTHSEETKKLISEKAKIRTKGEGNSQFGTRYMFNDMLGLSKRIKSDEIEIYKSNKWILGYKKYK